MAAGQGRGRAPRSSTACCARWRGAARGDGAAVAVPAGERRAAARRRSARPTSRSRAPRSAAGGSSGVSAIEPLFPKDAGGAAAVVIDSHTHLDLCEPPDAELVAAAEAAGVRRMLTVGIDGASCRAALAAAEAFPQVYAAVGRHPNAAKGFDDADLAELRALAAHERCVAIGETGLDFYRDRRAARRPAAGVRGADRARARDRQAARDPHARAPRRRRSRSWPPKREGVSVVMHCFSMPDRLDECLERGYAISFAGQRHLQERRRSRRGGRSACPRSACWSRPTRPT